MRNALIAALMAATIATPVAAQDRQGGRDAFSQRVQRTINQDRGGAREARQPRMERQQARQAQRVERQADRQTQRVERQAQRPAIGANAIRPNRQGVRPDRSRAQVRTPAANWPGQQQRANGGISRSIRDTIRTERRDDRRDARYERRDDRRDARYDRRDDRREWRGDRRDSRQSWNRNWRNDNRYDWQRYRYSNRSLFSLGRYYAPYNNYRYSRFSIGLMIGQPFYSDRYWLSNPGQYRLPPAYAGTRWVRYYDDVLLVDMYSGEVLDVIYDFFW